METLTLTALKKEVFENSQQLDLIFNSLPQSLALVNPNFEILRVNQNFLSLYGVKNEDVVGKRCHKACFGRDQVCEGCLVERALISKKAEKKIKSFPTGEICEMTAQPVLNARGEVTHVLDMRTNITELVEKERELRRVRFAMDQSTDEFWLFDKSWHVVYASQSASDNLGFSLKELIGFSIERFNLLHRIENLTVLFERIKKKKNLRVESVQYKKDGDTYPCEMNLSYFSDSEEYIYAVVRNITKRKKYENELIKSREEAEKASKLKSTFLAYMSHEIRTPLNAIIGFSNFVLEEELDEDTKTELKSEIKANSNYLLTIINDIMEISKIESGNRIAQIKPFLIKNKLERIYEEQKNSCPDGVDFKLKISLPDEQVLLESDGIFVGQILEHLVRNAMKFTRKGEIVLGCEFLTDKGGYRFFVSDTGIGIAKESQSEIFEPFFQLNPMMKGTGIGLTICTRLAKLLGSKIKISSEPGKGAEFSFLIKQ